MVTLYKAKSDKTAVILMGIQGSGKTYLYEKMFSEDYVHINLDTLKTRNKELVLLNECIDKSLSFAVDNTNPTKKDRKRYLTLAKSAGYRVIGYFVQSVLKDCIERNKRRTGKACLAPQAIASTSNRLEMPSRDEGFDELYFVSYTGSEINISKWREKNEV